MAASKKTKIKVKQVNRYAPDDTQINKKLGGGVLKELVTRDASTGEVIHYALAYINPAIYGGDNGRVLGYDNSHGESHKHYLGAYIPDPFTSYEELSERFQREWRGIAMKFVNGEPIV